jgi:preprotein translocase subunit SecY
VLNSIRNVFRIQELRRKIAFTIAMVAVYRLGAHLPVPGIDISQLTSLQDADNSKGVIGYLNVFSGGALENYAVFALGVMPYITASIIMQLLGVVIPKVEAWQQEGAVGQKKITQWTRYLTLGLALIQGSSTMFVFHNGGGPFALNDSNGNPIDLYPDGRFNLFRVGIGLVVLLAGTMLVMWIGEQISQRGIGNGTSVLIFSNVVSRLPSEGVRIWQTEPVFVFIAVLAIVVAMVVAIVTIENGQRRIPVQFPKRQVGRKMYAGQSTYIPLKVNMAGVIPIIFASSVVYFPILLANIVRWEPFQKFVNNNLAPQNDSPTYLLMSTLLIIFFAYFYTAIAFDPVKQADQLRKQNGFIPGVRPGPPTERFFARLLNRITLPGAVFIAIIALVPSLLFYTFGIQNFTLAGTSILIAVGVALETMKQINSQLLTKNYEGFLRQ